jgi:tRNA 2-selenouridine synthase
MITTGVKKIDIESFLSRAETTPIVDVRSPSEYLAGHIPGAINIPLLNDKERESVGIKYKNEGTLSAIYEGLNLTAPNLSAKLQKAFELAVDRQLLLYCWRGGMRSEAMSWLFSLANIEAEVLQGGYKSYRHHILESLSVKRKMIVLGGMTGSSKTHILRFLNSIGEQVIDLEDLAKHKGSAFGALGQPSQPSTEHFANLLFTEWRKLNQSFPVWVEDESRNIGSVFMPETFYLNMQDAKVIVLIMEVKTRIPRLLEEYSKYPVEALKASVQKISKRLGGDNTRDAILALESGDIARAIVITLNYYDKTYQYGLKKKKAENIIYIETNTYNVEINSRKILDAATNINW